MNAKHLITGTLIIGLSACGTPSDPLNTQQNQEISARGITLTPVPADFKPSIHMQTRGKAVAGFVFSTIIGSAAASGGMGGQMPSTELTQISMEFGKNVGQLTSEVIDRAGNQAQKSSPYLMMHRWLGENLQQAQRLKNNSDAVQMKITQNLWELHYSGMFNSAYQINYELNTRLTDKPSKLDRTIPCAGTYEDKYTLEEWKANDHEKINAAAKRIARHCTNQVLKELGLPPAAE